MSLAALVTWVIAAGFGFFMVSIWLRNGGASDGSGASSHLNPAMVLTHGLLAAGGLVLWVVYLFVDSTALAWVAFVDLLVVATVGDLLVFRWGRDHRLAAHAVGSMPASAGLAEQRIPLPVVVTHGVFAVATVVLVLLSALEIGGS
jgi:hypothetical protein